MCSDEGIDIAITSFEMILPLLPDDIAGYVDIGNNREYITSAAITQLNDIMYKGSVEMFAP